MTAWVRRVQMDDWSTRVLPVLKADAEYQRLVGVFSTLPPWSPEEGLACMMLADRAEELGLLDLAALWRSEGERLAKRARGKGEG